MEFTSETERYESGSIPRELPAFTPEQQDLQEIIDELSSD